MRDFLQALAPEHRKAVHAEMIEVATHGLVVARHVRGDIYEVRASSETMAFRILFAVEGRYSQILLALEGFQKRTQQLPPAKIRLAQRRLADWRQRGERGTT